MPRLSMRQWDLLVRQARASSLLGRLAWLAERECGGLDGLPPEPAAHLRWGMTLAEACAREIRCEVDWVLAALEPIGVRPILLKGAAYTLAGMPVGRGRFFEDVDILVARERLADAEAALLVAGWAQTHLDPYDQRYYREWMHELPPLVNMRRGTTVDVHYNILPETGRLRPEAVRLLEAARPLPGSGVLRTLCPEDMVLHSASHLFCDGEFNNGLRDLSDLDLLMRYFGEEDGFWTGLLDRAETLGLGGPLYYAVTLTDRVLDTPVPEAVLAEAKRMGPPFVRRGAMDLLFRAGLRPPHPSCRGIGAEAAHFLLFVRGHWLKMPPLRLARHLVRKAFVRDQYAAD